MGLKIDHQMSLSKIKCLYSYNCLHFLKHAVPLAELIYEWTNSLFTLYIYGSTWVADLMLH